jgi:hypothetical protein
MFGSPPPYSDYTEVDLFENDLNSEEKMSDAFSKGTAYLIVSVFTTWGMGAAYTDYTFKGIDNDYWKYLYYAVGISVCQY